MGANHTALAALPYRAQIKRRRCHTSPLVIVTGPRITKDCDRKSNHEVIANWGDYQRVKGMIATPVSKVVQQPSCSQPQPISITPDFSAFSQYSPQYLLPSSGRQSQAGWAHLPDSFSAIELLLARYLIVKLPIQTVKRSGRTAHNDCSLPIAESQNHRPIELNRMLFSVHATTHSSRRTRGCKYHRPGRDSR